MTVYIWCNVALLVTCTLVLSCPAGKGGFECETWVVGANSKILGGPEQTRKILMKESQQRVQSNHGLRLWRTYSQGASRRWPFKSVQSYDCIIMPIEEKSHVFLAYHLCLIIIINVCRLDFQYWLMFIFRRLKINHDPHEFILESRTVAKRYNPLKAIKLVSAGEGNNNKLCRINVEPAANSLYWCANFNYFIYTANPISGHSYIHTCS